MDIRSEPLSLTQLRQEAFKELQEFNKSHGVFSKKMKRTKQSNDVENTESEMDESNMTPTKLKRQLSFTDNEQASPRAAFKLPTPKRKKRTLTDDIDGNGETTPVRTSMLSPQKNYLSEASVDNLAIQEFFAEDYVKQEMQSDESLQSTLEAEHIPMVVIPPPTPEKKRKKQPSESNESNNGKLDSDTGNSSQNESKAKKKSKKDKRASVQPPPPKPPSSVEKYFKHHVFTGKPKKARKAFDKLSKKERKLLQTEYNDKVESYVSHLKKYLASLPRDEAVAYVSFVVYCMKRIFS